MRWQESLGVAVASGVVIPAILGAAQLVWRRRRVPTALVQSVRRRSYLDAVLTESQREEVATLEVLAPRLTSAGGNETTRQLRSSWEQINARGKVRVLTLDSEECLKGGAELAEGIEVRIARRDLGSEGLSYHVFGVPSRTTCNVIVNHHQDLVDRPLKLIGSPPAQVFRNHFDAVWSTSKPLESVLAERVMASTGQPPDTHAVVRALADVAADLHFGSNLYQRVLTHLAFRHGCSVVFVVGLPGAGKSLVRRKLADRLRASGIETRELSDYVYAYRDFLHGRIQLQPSRGSGFQPYDGGAFTIRDESTLMPALQALVQAVRESAKDHQVLLVEFARVDLVAALQEFDELRCRSQVIHLKASPARRLERLGRRAEQPDLTTDGQSVRVLLSDDHALPSAVCREIYQCDDIDRLTASSRWRNRVFRIDNEFDDGGAHIDATLPGFIEAVVKPYRTIPVGRGYGAS